MNKTIWKWPTSGVESQATAKPAIIIHPTSVDVQVISPERKITLTITEFGNNNNKLNIDIW